MNRIISSLPEKYENIVKNLKDSLDEKYYFVDYQIIWGELSAKCNIMNAQSNQNIGE